MQTINNATKLTIADNMFAEFPSCVGDDDDLEYNVGDGVVGAVGAVGAVGDDVVGDDVAAVGDEEIGSEVGDELSSIEYMIH